LIKNNKIYFLITGALMVLCFILNICFAGTASYSINFNDFVFQEIRLPKALTCLAAGAGLSAAGLILQVIFRNPLAGPYALGISSGSSLFLAILTLSNLSLTQFKLQFMDKGLSILFSIVGGLIITFLILSISKKIKSNLILLLVGLMVAQICSAIQGVLEYTANPNNLKNFIVFSMGSLTISNQTEAFVLLSITIVTLSSLIFLIKPLNAFLFGEDYAVNLGFNYTKYRFYLILIASVLTGVITAFCGPIAFVGLAIPILSRWVLKTSHQGLQLISGIILGSTLLLICDLVSNALIKDVIIPINTLTSLVGAPIVISLLFKSKTW
jgi:iron complex transport system permease protein